MSGKRLGFVGSELVHLAASFGVDAQFFVVFGLELGVEFDQVQELSEVLHKILVGNAFVEVAVSEQRQCDDLSLRKGQRLELLQAVGELSWLQEALGILVAVAEDLKQV